MHGTWYRLCWTHWTPRHHKNSSMNEKLLSFVCNAPCHWVGKHLEFCKQIKERKCTNYEENVLWTWKPKNSLWIYLIKVETYTLVYVPSQDNLFFVNPMFYLAKECPSTSIFMCQLMSDSNTHPKMLAVDLLCDANKSCASVSPSDRYSKLRHYSQYFPELFLNVQWCGNREALTSTFLDSLPHCVDCVFGITHDIEEIVIDD